MRGHRHPLGAGRARRSGGFSLVELIVGLAVTSMLLLAIVGVFAAGSKVARVETQTSDLQQTLRASHRQITRYVNMAGRGGLALSLASVPVFQGPALAVRNNVGNDGDNGEIAVGFDGTPKAEDNSDILITRGVFTTEVYQVNTLNAAQFILTNGGTPTSDPTTATAGTVIIQAMTNTGIEQDLTPFATAIAGNIPEALVLQSPMDERIVAVVELDFANSGVVGNQATIAFKVQNMTHADYRDLYASGAGAQPVLPVGLNSVANVGILEEYRFYVRKPRTPLPGLPPDSPTLSMARMFPGTEIPYLSTLANAGVDLADNVLDMQVALAFDSPAEPGPTEECPTPPCDLNGDDEVDENDLQIYQSDDGENDDWLFNTSEDDPATAPWSGGAPQPELYWLRLSLLARTAGRERNHRAEQLLGYEDVDPLRILGWNSFDERMYRRRFQQTVIELRNL